MERRIDMSDIDFQNGFLCGLATKGLIKTGAQYEPVIWNDEGVYDYFYIDFKRALAPFISGMFLDSILVFGKDKLSITGVEKVAPSRVKVYCDISGLAQGVLVVHKKNSFLSFSDSRTIPDFSVLFYVAGIPSVFYLKHMYDEVRGLGSIILPNRMERDSIVLLDEDLTLSLQEVIEWPEHIVSSTVVETCSVELV